MEITFRLKTEHWFYITFTILAFFSCSSGAVCSKIFDSADSEEMFDPWIKGGVLSYLFTTADDKIKNDLQILFNYLDLNSEEQNKLKELGLYEAKFIYEIKKKDYEWRDKNKGSSNDKKDIHSTNINKKLVDLQSEIDESVEDILEDEYAKFREWTRNWWKKEIQFRGKKRKELMQIGPALEVTCYVFATQFDLPSVAVALPDKYIKFANLNWPILDSYGDWYQNSTYYVTVIRDEYILEAPVMDVGPWNEDDNYWNYAEWFSEGFPPYRRMFDELSLCMPEARAAFERNYNNGLDQFGRQVLNAAGIDLTFEAAEKLGLGFLENAWVTVVFDNFY